MKTALWLVTVAGMFVSATLLNRYWQENPMTPERMLQGVASEELYPMVALAVCLVSALYIAVDEIRRARRRS